MGKFQFERERRRVPEVLVEPDQRVHRHHALRNAIAPEVVERDESGAEVLMIEIARLPGAGCALAPPANAQVIRVRRPAVRGDLQLDVAVAHLQRPIGWHRYGVKRHVLHGKSRSVGDTGRRVDDSRRGGGSGLPRRALNGHLPVHAFPHISHVRQPDRAESLTVSRHPRSIR
jgi:hypothetical protein